MSDKRSIKKILLGAALLIIVGIVLYGTNLANKQAAGSKDSGGLFLLKTWSRTDCTSTPYAVGVTKGFFKEEGIEIVFTGDTQPNQRIPSLLNGNNDIGGAHPNNLAVAIAGGAKIRGVAAADIDPTPDKDPKLRHMNWYINPNVHPDVHTFADLNKLSGQLKFSLITVNQCSDFLGNNIADHSGVPRSKIEWITMPDVQAVQALKQGLVTVSGVHPPYYKSMEEAGMLKIADSLDAGFEQAGGLYFYFFTEDFIQKHPDVIKRFVRAITKAQKWANEHPEEARQITEDWIHVPVSATHYYAEDPKINEVYVEPWLKDLEDSGVLPKGKLKPSDIITHEFDH